MDYELTDKIRSSSVWTSEDLHGNVLFKKSAKKLSVNSFFPGKLSGSSHKNESTRGNAWS